MADKCFVCNVAVDEQQIHVSGSRSEHSNIPIAVFIKSILRDFHSVRDLDDPSNVVCMQCLQRLNECDWQRILAKRCELELYELLVCTETQLVTGHAPLADIPIPSHLVKIEPEYMDDGDTANIWRASDNNDAMAQLLVPQVQLESSKRRGRPRIHPVKDDMPKKRGRPFKNPLHPSNIAKRMRTTVLDEQNSQLENTVELNRTAPEALHNSTQINVQPLSISFDVLGLKRRPGRPRIHPVKTGEPKKRGRPKLIQSLLNTSLLPRIKAVNSGARDALVSKSTEAPRFRPIQIKTEFDERRPSTNASDIRDISNIFDQSSHQPEDTLQVNSTAPSGKENEESDSQLNVKSESLPLSSSTPEVKRRPDRPRILPIKLQDGASIQRGRPRIHPIKIRYVPKPGEKRRGRPPRHLIDQLHQSNPADSIEHSIDQPNHTYDLPALENSAIPDENPFSISLPAKLHIFGAKKRRGRPRIRPIKQKYVPKPGEKRRGRPPKHSFDQSHQSNPADSIEHSIDQPNHTYDLPALGNSTIPDENPFSISLPAKLHIFGAKKRRGRPRIRPMKQIYVPKPGEKRRGRPPNHPIDQSTQCNPDDSTEHSISQQNHTNDPAALENSTIPDENPFSISLPAKPHIFGAKKRPGRPRIRPIKQRYVPKPGEKRRGRPPKHLLDASSVSTEQTLQPIPTDFLELSIGQPNHSFEPNDEMINSTMLDDNPHSLSLPASSTHTGRVEKRPGRPRVRPIKAKYVPKPGEKRRGRPPKHLIRSNDESNAAEPSHLLASPDTMGHSSELQNQLYETIESDSTDPDEYRHGSVSVGSFLSGVTKRRGRPRIRPMKPEREPGVIVRRGRPRIRPLKPKREPGVIVRRGRPRKRPLQPLSDAGVTKRRGPQPRLLPTELPFGMSAEMSTERYSMCKNFHMDLLPYNVNVKIEPDDVNDSDDTIIMPIMHAYNNTNEQVPVNGAM